jgi:hypothetical protein
MKFLIVTTTLGLLATAALAQSPYAGLQTRPIKTLSEQQVADLKAGRGMGLALAAELNGYPGPAHVLDRSAGSLMNAGARGADHALGWPSKSRQRLPELCPSIRLLFNYKLCDASSGARVFVLW